MAFIYSKKLDFRLFTLPVILGLLTGLLLSPFINYKAPYWFLYNIIVLIGLDIAHGYATHFYVYLNPKERSSHHTSHLMIPVFVFSFFFASSIFLNTHTIWLLVVYLSIWHFVRQQIGWLKWTQRNESVSQLQTQVDHFIVYWSTIGAVFYWHLDGVNAIWGWGVNFYKFSFISPHMYIYTYLTPLLLYYLFIAYNTAYKKNLVNWGKQQIIFVSCFSWGASMVFLVRNPLYVGLLVLMPHAIQYYYLIRKQLIVSPFKFKRAINPLWPILILSVFFAFGEEHLRAFLYSTPKSNIPNERWSDNSQVLFLLLQALVITPIVSHYLFDAVIWKRKKSPILKKWL